MRLFVLGPAFGGPSIDPQCVAAVALLRAWEKRTGGTWELVCAATDFDRLPMLELDGRRLHGFREIARYLDAHGGQSKTAEHISIEAFVESHGQTLLDIAYYVSYENYSARTRPAFTKILPWYANYALPPRRRAAARERTAHLGIQGIDMDDVHESVLDDKPAESMSLAERKFNDNDTNRRARTLLGRKRTVQSMLRQPEHSGAFKLKNLADNFYEPLAAMMEEEKDTLLRDNNGLPGEAACLVYGYLSLLANGQLPQSWAADIMSSHHKSLKRFVDKVGEQLELQTDEGTSKTTSGLPWKPSPAVSLKSKLSFCGNALIRQLPFLPDTEPVNSRRRTLADWLPQAMFSTAASIALTGWALYRFGFWPEGQEMHVFGRKRLADYGAAGAMLSALDGLA